MIKYGIWNDYDKRFVFGISEDTPEEADEIFKKSVTKDTYLKHRYQIRKIPEGYKNKPNLKYAPNALPNNHYC